METSTQIKVIGFSGAVLEKIRSFMSSIGEHNNSLIAMIGLVHSSVILRDDGTLVRTGNRFVLGALAKKDLDDEICINEDGTEIAIRIPDAERFHGSYYFDVHEGEIVNLDAKMMRSS